MLRITRKIAPIGLACALLMTAPVASAVGLNKLYEEALAMDAPYASARAALEAAETIPGQVGGQMLPQLALHTQRTRTKTDWEYLPRSIKKDYDFHGRSASLNLSLALIRPQLWAEYARSKAEFRVAEAEFSNASQELVLRLSQAYFNLLLAEDNLNLAREQKAATTELLNLTKRYYEAGVGTVTDINEAQARFDTIVAQEIAAESNLELRVRVLEGIVGKPYRELHRLGSRIVLETPEPRDVDAWIDMAMSGNPQVRAAQASLEVVEKESLRSKAAHLPTLDLVAQRSDQRSPGYTTIDEKTETSSVWFQLTVPIFSGGSTQGRVRQTSALLTKAHSDLDNARRNITVGTREQFLNVINGIARVNALAQAVKSNDIALYSARKGQEAGLRTSFDVLNAQQLLFSAKRDLAQARYDYVLSRLRLRGMVGLLNVDDVELVQSWLDVPAS